MIILSSKSPWSDRQRRHNPIEEVDNFNRSDPNMSGSTNDFCYHHDVEHVTLDKKNKNKTIVINNQKGNNGVVRLNLDHECVPIGTAWRLNIIYGFNSSSKHNRPTSLVVAYGANNHAITAMMNISDGQTVLSVDRPQDNGFTLQYGNLEREIVDSTAVVKAVGSELRKFYLSTISPDSTYSTKPTCGNESSGTPTLSNFGVVECDVSIRYLGVERNSELKTSDPTYLFNVTNAYYAYKNE
jgi:hypothetical protein